MPAATPRRSSADERGRVRDDILRLCSRGLTVRVLLAEVAARLRRVVAYDGAYLATLDPTNMIFTGGVVDDLPPELCHPYYVNELTESDVLKFSDLAGRRQPSGVLSAETDGRPEASARFQTILSPLGATDELRVLFRCGATSWGAADLTRAGRPFDASEAAFVASLAVPVGRALSAAARLHLFDPTTAPGMMVIGGDGLIESATAEAAARLPGLHAEGLPAERLGDRQPPEAVHAVALRARDASRRTPARSLVRHNGDRWLSLHASLLDGPVGGRVAVVISEAHPTQLARLLMHAYGLSEREREVALLVIDGASTAEIATALALSSHTIRDHLKAVFHKLEVTSRGGLVAQLTADRYTRLVNATERVSTR